MKEEDLKGNIEQAKVKYKEAWWDSDDPVVVFLGQIQEPILLIDFSAFQKAAEEALGRPVWTHEFAEPKELLDDIIKKDQKQR